MTSEPTRPAFSIIVCTHDRAASLAHTLDSVAALDPVPGAAAELLVVDNNAGEATAAVLASAAHRQPLRTVVEREQGLAHARNRGLREAAGELLLFIDDDVVLDPGWLRMYATAADRNPQAMFFGGRIRPGWPSGRPAWVRDENMALLAGVFGSYDLGDTTRPLGPGDGGPMGANFAIRRALSDDIGAFDPALGRRGDDLGRGEDTEYFRRAAAAGHRGVYVAGALCQHRVAPERLTLPALYRHGLAKGRVHHRLADDDARGSPAAAAGFALRGTAQLLMGRGDRFRQCVINAGIQMGLPR